MKIPRISWVPRKNTRSILDGYKLILTNLLVWMGISTFTSKEFGPFFAGYLADWQWFEHIFYLTKVTLAAIRGLRAWMHSPPKISHRFGHFLNVDYHGFSQKVSWNGGTPSSHHKGVFFIFGYSIPPISYGKPPLYMFIDVFFSDFPV